MKHVMKIKRIYTLQRISLYINKRLIISNCSSFSLYEYLMAQ